MRDFAAGILAEIAVEARIGQRSRVGGEHRLVRGKDGNADLTKIPKAFFDCNAYVSMGFFAATLIDALAG